MRRSGGRHSKNFRLHPLPDVGPGALAREQVVSPHRTNVPVHQWRFAQEYRVPFATAWYIEAA